MFRSSWLLACMFFAFVGCGSDDHPDTGYGANETVPAPLTCSVLCNRLSDCVVQLCNEDTSSSRYDGLESFLVDDCLNGCTDDLVQSKFTAPEWSCMFTDSCRQIFEHDSCMNDS